jgi:hypothetical protein
MQPQSASYGVFNLKSLWILHCVRNDKSVGVTRWVALFVLNEEWRGDFYCHCEKAKGRRGNLLINRRLLRYARNDSGTATPVLPLE